jgi:hypothetical protein
MILIRYAAGPALALALLAGCQKASEPPPEPSPEDRSSAPLVPLPNDDYGVGEDHSVAIGPPPPPSPAATQRTGGTPIAAALTRAEWAKAANRARCAALAFTDDGGAPASARRANFSGGWAVAFDLAGRRSAYGVAGTGSLPDDNAPYAQRRSALAGTWPYAWASNDTGRLPPASFAGYGIEGRGAYSDADPKGMAVKTLAYLIVPGQRCTYNVWTTLGRDHMMRLLNGLTILTR